MAIVAQNILLAQLLRKRSLCEYFYEIKSGAYGAQHSMVTLGRKITVKRKLNTLGVTAQQLSAIDALVHIELIKMGEAMVKEAKYLSPTPATVPRVTVPSLAGVDYTGVTSPFQKSPAEKKKASELLIHRLGKSRMLLLSKHGFVDSSAPSKDELSSYGGLTAMKRAGRRRGKSIATSHLRGTARDTASNFRRIYMPIAGVNIKVSDYKRSHGISPNQFVKGRSYAATGDLKRSIKYKVNGLILDVYSGCPYALEIEYGWGLRGQKYPHPPIQDAGNLEFIIRDSYTKFIPMGKRNVRLAGARAQPFMYPAYLKFIKTLPSKINNCIRRVLSAL